MQAAQKTNQPETYIDFVNSPDDGGWYVQETRAEKPFGSRVSEAIYPSMEKAETAFLRHQLKWTDWS